MEVSGDPRILFFDIETTNLNADFGFIVCISYAWNNEKVKTICVTDFPQFKTNPTDDSAVVKAFAEIYNSADIVSGWFSKYFDVPFINTRLLFHKQKPLAMVSHVDCWFTARKNLKLHSNRLASVQSFLDLPDEKTLIKPAIWLRAMSGHRPSIKYVVDHCVADIEVLRQAFEKLRPFLVSNPLLHLSKDPEKPNCTRCGSAKLQRRGVYIASTRRYHRYQCQNCGAWSKGEWVDRKKK